MSGPAAPATRPRTAAGGDRSKLEDRAFSGALVFSTLLAVILTAPSLTSEPVWNDEIASLALVSRSFGALLDQFTHEHNGVLFQLALWPIVHLGGVTSGWLRLPALVAFAACPPVLGLVTARLLGRTAGVAAAALLALSPFGVYYGQEGRTYAFALLFSLVAVLALQRALQRPTVRRFAVYAAAVALTGYSHDFALLTVLAHPFLVWRHGPQARRGFVLALAGAAVALIPLAILAALDWGSNPLYWLYRPGPRDIWQIVRTFGGSVAGVAVSAAGLVALAAGIASARRRGEHAVPAGVLPFAFTWLLAPGAVLLVISLAKPLLIDRYLLPSLPALCLLLAASVVVLPGRSRFVPPILAALAFLAISVRDDVRLSKPDWPAAAALVQGEPPGSRTVFVGDSLMNADAMSYYGHFGIARDELAWRPSERSRLPASFVITRRGGLGQQFAAASANTRGELWIVQKGVIRQPDLSELRAFVGGCDVRARFQLRQITVTELSRCRG
jgi:mannosyltransferase